MVPISYVEASLRTEAQREYPLAMVQTRLGSSGKGRWDGDERNPDYERVESNLVSPHVLRFYFILIILDNWMIITSL